MTYLGNIRILDGYKMGFLCSRKIPATAVLRCYDWAIDQREKGRCVVTGVHSVIEKGVTAILLKGYQPLVILLA
jgi:hypothetical protein